MSISASVVRPIRGISLALVLLVVTSCGGGGGGGALESGGNTAPGGTEETPTEMPMNTATPWTAYIGAHYAATPASGIARQWAAGGLRDPGGIGTNYEPLANAQGGYDDPAYANFASKALPQLDALLEQGRQAVVSLAVGGSPDFLDSMRTQTGRDAYRKAIEDRVAAIHALPHASGWEGRVHFQFGNEISNVNATGFYGRVCLWVTAGATANCDLATQFTPAYVEEYLAPGIETLQARSLALFGRPDAMRIMLGSIVNLVKKQAFADALLEYQIQGTKAPSLAGRKVHELVDAVSIHYTMVDPDYLGALDAFRNNWLPGGTPRSRVRALWSTEELGQNAASQGYGMATALKDLARYLTYWRTHSITPDDGHMFFWGSDMVSCDGCTSLDADMHYLYDFTGEASLDPTSGKAVAVGGGAIELHDFAVGGQDKRVVVIFSPDMTDSALTSLTLDLGAWAGKSVSVTAYRFAGQGGQALAVTPTSIVASSAVSIQIPTPIAQRDAILLLVAAR